MKKVSTLAVPYIVWAVLMLAIPMILILFYSATKDGNGILKVSFTLENYIRFFTDKDFLLVLWNSVKIALKTTIICIVIGYPIAYFISQSSDKVRNLLILLITMPMWINMLVRTYAWIGILSEGGIAQKVLGIFGMGDAKLLYTEGAVLLGMI